MGRNGAQESDETEGIPPGVRNGETHALLTHGTPLQVRIFEEREATAEWLGVSIDVLEAK
jgi:hypothetical protein